MTSIDNKQVDLKSINHDHHNNIINLMPSCNFITSNNENLKIQTLNSSNNLSENLNISFSIYFLELLNSNYFTILKKGDLLIKISTFKNNKLIINDNIINYNFNLYKWYHVYLTFKNDKLFIKITKYNKLEFEQELNFNNLNSIINNFNPFIIPPKIENLKTFKGILQNLFFYFSNEFLNFNFEYSFPPMEISNEPFKVISEPIYSIDQEFNFNDHLNISKIDYKNNFTKNRQKVILCHDMKGGYLNDKFIQSGNDFLSFNFNFWQFIDIFIYFSHERITIPPVGWTEIAHKNGIKVLGNLIFEWDEGSIEITKMLNGNYKQFADYLINLAIYYKFDGWFLNIECNLNQELCKKLIDFIKYLKMECKLKIKNSKIIWYDSIIYPNGELKWQNELNEKNFIFLKQCDGIFLNYGWKPEMLNNSILNLNINETNLINLNINENENNLIKKLNKYKIFTGIDIFGRGQYGGGQFNTNIALNEINKYETSIGLFAPGFIYENYFNNFTNLENIENLNLIRNEYENIENLFWNGNFKFIELLKNGNGQLNEFEGWNINGNWIKSVNNDFNQSKSFISSFNWCKMEQTINFPFIVNEYLNENNLKNIKNLQNNLILNAKCWIKGTEPNYQDLFYLKIKFLDENDKIIKEFNSGEITCSSKWKCLNFNFILKNINSINKIIWEHGGKDVEYWAGNFGSRISNCSLNLKLNVKNENISNYLNEKLIKNLFSTFFNSGVGLNYYIYGNDQNVLKWNDISEQDLLPNFRNYKITNIGQDYSINWNFNYLDSFLGGNCLEFYGKFNQEEVKLTRFKLFKTSIKLNNNLNDNNRNIIYIQYAYKYGNEFNEKCSSLNLLIETVNLGLINLNESKNIITKVNDEILNSNWILRTYSLTMDNNDEITNIYIDCSQNESCLQVDSCEEHSIIDTNEQDYYSMKLGYLNIGEKLLDLRLKSIDEFEIVKSFNEATLEESQLLCDLNLKWKPIDNCYKYFIFKQGENGELELLGRTLRPFYRINKQADNVKLVIKYL